MHIKTEVCTKAKQIKQWTFLYFWEKLLKEKKVIHLAQEQTSFRNNKLTLNTDLAQNFNKSYVAD